MRCMLPARLHIAKLHILPIVSTFSYHIRVLCCSQIRVDVVLATSSASSGGEPEVSAASPMIARTPTQARRVERVKESLSKKTLRGAQQQIARPTKRSKPGAAREPAQQRRQSGGKAARADTASTSAIVRLDPVKPMRSSSVKQLPKSAPSSGSTDVSSERSIGIELPKPLHLHRQKSGSSNSSPTHAKLSERQKSLPRLQSPQSTPRTSAMLSPGTPGSRDQSWF